MDYPLLDLKATGKRIKELRKARNLKVDDIASFMGFDSPQAVYKWQRGDSLPTVDNLYALSKLFETPVDDILRGKEERDERSSLLFFAIRPSCGRRVCPSGHRTDNEESSRVLFPARIRNIYQRFILRLKSLVYTCSKHGGDTSGRRAERKKIYS